MIRIDEIYGNTFWPFIKNQVPNTKLYCCDPPGNTNPDSLIHFGGNSIDMINYIFFHDQEPIHLDIYADLFAEVYDRNPLDNISYVDARRCHGIVTSEFNSESVEELCKKYNWKSYYYFFHGWAALDWYRGYDKTFLITTPDKRKITKTFIAPNRIIAGERKHRLEMLYHIFKNQMLDNHISCPEICPVENISIHELSNPWLNVILTLSQCLLAHLYLYNLLAKLIILCIRAGLVCSTKPQIVYCIWSQKLCTQDVDYI